MAFVFPEENWWARFVPWLWYGSLLLLVPACFQKRCILAFLLVLFITVNNGAFFAWNMLNGIVNTNSIHRFISDLRQSDAQEVAIVIHSESFLESTKEKLRRFHVDKKVDFVIDTSIATPQTRNPAWKGFYPFTGIKGWYAP
jgi:hypothetical protein